MLGDLVMVRIGSHGVGSLRRVDNIVTGLRRYTNRQLLALSLTKKGFQPGFRPRLPLKRRGNEGGPAGVVAHSRAPKLRCVE